MKDNPNMRPNAQQSDNFLSELNRDIAVKHLLQDGFKSQQANALVSTFILTIIATGGIM